MFDCCCSSFTSISFFLLLVPLGIGKVVSHELTLQTLFFFLQTINLFLAGQGWTLGIMNYVVPCLCQDGNDNDAFVTIFCPWTHSATVVHWWQKIKLMRAGLDIGEHGKEHNRNEIMASQLLFSHHLTLQMLPSFYNRQSIWANENEHPAHLLWIDLPIVATWTPANMSSQAILWVVTASSCKNEHPLLVVLVWEPRSIESININYIAKQLIWLILWL